MKLPTNQKMLESIKAIHASHQTIQWDKMLDMKPSSVYKFLYSLQIINSLMESHGAVQVFIYISYIWINFCCIHSHLLTGFPFFYYDIQMQEEERVKWCKDFLYSGGFREIFQIFTTTEIDAKYAASQAWKSCLPLLLKIINFFIQGKHICIFYLYQSIYLSVYRQTNNKLILYLIIVRISILKRRSLCNGSCRCKWAQ